MFTTIYYRINIVSGAIRHKCVCITAIFLCLSLISGCVENGPLNFSITGSNEIEQMVNQLVHSEDSQDFFPGVKHFVPSDTGTVTFIKYVSQDNKIRFSAPESWVLEDSGDLGFSFLVDSNENRKFQMILNSTQPGSITVAEYSVQLLNYYIASDSTDVETNYTDMTADDDIPVVFINADNKLKEKGYYVLVTGSPSTIVNFTYGYNTSNSMLDKQILTYVLNSIRLDGRFLLSN